MSDPVLMWFRRDLRLSDNRALAAAIAAGGPVIPVFLHDEPVEEMGAAPRFRLDRALEALAAALEAAGSRLILRRGPAQAALEALVKDTGARGLHWTRLYTGPGRARDAAVKAWAKGAGLEVHSHPGHVLHEPWTVETKSGGFFKVYTPFWKAVKDRDVPDPVAAPSRIPAPDAWPASDRRADWRLSRAMDRGAAIVAGHLTVGEAAARGRLGAFIAHGIDQYAARRDRLDLDATSHLSENLAWGEISPATCWHAGCRALEDGKDQAEVFLQELVWRDFAWHLMHHTPHIADRSWREEWHDFPWEDDGAPAERWRRGETGEPVVDAAMREMYVTGRMHNRARMIVGSYLTKHLLTHWRVGERWFAECLVDWDPASNAMGWQWVAGSGPDATPYFRVFNPATQADKFDPDGTYRDRWLGQGALARSFFDAVPRAWRLDPQAPRPGRMVELKAGRQRALDAYHAHRN